MAEEAAARARSAVDQQVSQRRLYYGWIQVGTLALTELVSWGILYYVFTVIQMPMQHELGWSRSALTGAFSLALLVAGITAVPVGRWLDRHGPRALMTLGSVLATLLMLALARVQTLPMFYLVWGGIGVAMAMVLYEPAFAVVATWFIRQRSRALTLLTLGGGLASVVFVPLAERLVSAYGWREALTLLAGLLAGITIPLHALVLRRSPADIGSLPDGDPAPASGHPLAVVGPAVSLHAALRATAFWWLALAFALSQLATVALGVHLIPLLLEWGYGAAFAATALAVLGGSQLPGRLIFAPLSHLVSRRMVNAIMFVLQLLALLVLLGLPTPWGVLAFAVLFGIGAGASSPGRAALVADLYGAQQYGSISGVLALLLTLARAGAPLSASLAYSGVGSYTPLLIIAVLLFGGATMAVLLVHEQVVVMQDGDGCNSKLGHSTAHASTRGTR